MRRASSERLWETSFFREGLICETASMFWNGTGTSISALEVDVIVGVKGVREW